MTVLKLPRRGRHRRAVIPGDLAYAALRWIVLACAVLFALTVIIGAAGGH
jgi:hypothetical protein